jgi:hypothetical protein
MDSTEIEAQRPDSDQPASIQLCPGCGMAQESWGESDGEGFAYGDATYCCRGCAEETGCTCG